MEFILFVAVVILLIWVARVSSRLSSLERKLNQVPTPQTMAAMPNLQPTNLSPAHIFSQSQAAAIPQSAILPMPEPPKQAVSPQKTASEDTENAVNWLNRIGVVALVLGLGFFLKIAIDLGWIGPWLQIIIGLLIGGLLVYLGELWKARFGEKAQALSGGGVAILYFSVYAAFNFYHLVPAVLAFLFMVAVAGFAVWLSYRNSSLVLGVLAFFGAYGAPLLFNPGQDNQVMLFSYLTVINIAAVAVMFKKYWNQLLILTIVGTIIDFAVWGGNFSTYQNTLTSLSFVIISAIIYAVGSAALVRLHSTKKTLPADFENNMAALTITNGVFYFVSIYALLFNQYHDILPAVALLGGIVFFFCYALLDRLNYRNLNYCLSFVASVLLVFAAIWKFDGKALSAVFLVLGLLGTGVGTMVKREELRVWGIAVLFISLFKSLFDPYGVGDATFLFNAKFGLMFANTLALLFVGWLYQKIQTSDFEKSVEKLLQVVAAVVLWGAVSWDIFLPQHGLNRADSFMTLWWVIYPAALAGTAFLSRRKELFKTAVVLLAASFFKVLFLPYTADYIFLYNIKFGLMVLETAVLLVFARISEKQGDSTEFFDLFKVLASLLLWFAVSWEIVKYFENDISKNSRNLYLSLWWIAYSAILMGAGIMWRSSLFRKIAIGLFFVTIAKVFLYDLLSLDLGYLIVSFISLGVILISVSFFYRKHKDQITKFLN
jgi:uncharacterized membrane protein